MDDRPRRGWWSVIVPLGLALLWVDLVIAYVADYLDLYWSVRFNTLSQLSIAVGIGTVDLWVIYYVVGLGEHAGAIGAWLNRAFTGAGLKVMTKCPRCGYEERAPEPSRAETLLKRRESGGS